MLLLLVVLVLVIDVVLILFALFAATIGSTGEVLQCGLSEVYVPEFEHILVLLKEMRHVYLSSKVLKDWLAFGGWLSICALLLQYLGLATSLQVRASRQELQILVLSPSISCPPGAQRGQRFIQQSGSYSLILKSLNRVRIKQDGCW